MWGVHVAVAQLHNRVPIGYNGMFKFTPKIALLNFGNHHPNLIHSSLDRPHSSPQMASGSNQPFCHKTLFGQTDWHMG